MRESDEERPPSRGESRFGCTVTCNEEDTNVFVRPERKRAIWEISRVGNSLTFANFSGFEKTPRHLILRI